MGKLGEWQSVGKRKSMTVQGNFDRIVNIDRSELFFLGV